MKEAAIIFPTQLFKNNPCVKKERQIFLIEEKRYFTDFKFHKQKLILHRASMKAYEDYLIKEGHKVQYIEFNQNWNAQVKQFDLYTTNPYDSKLKSQLPKKTTFVSSPGFLQSSLKKSKKYFMANFYKEQRKRLNILIDKGKPIGGKWSFDKDNRKKPPNNYIFPKIESYANKYTKEAQKYITKNFSNNPGETEEFIYPTTHKEAKKWLHNFVKSRLEYFGDYEDAIAKDHPFINHSILSPLLNIGLITPKEVIKGVLSANVPLNSKEGFIRQIIGWREFIAQIYLLEEKTQKEANYFKNKKPLPKEFYTAQTNILPVDNTIKKIIKYAYSHHIERLMVLGNYMLLNQIHPNHVYNWFMEMHIDAYDWVMTPNIYGMSQYADGGLMATKPYISSSKYICKMSDYSKGEWCQIWDDLFWSFLKKHKVKLAKNPRMALLLKYVDKK